MKKIDKMHEEMVDIREKIKESREKAGIFVGDFKKFAFKGNVIDLAVGIIIGAAFNDIVQSLVNDLVMPIFGKLLGNSSFEDLFINLSDTYYATLAEAELAEAPVIKYGSFISSVLNFLIIALTLYVVLKILLRKKEEHNEEEEEEKKISN